MLTSSRRGSVRPPEGIAQILTVQSSEADAITLSLKGHLNEDNECKIRSTTGDDLPSQIKHRGGVSINMMSRTSSTNTTSLFNRKNKKRTATSAFYDNGNKLNTLVITILIIIKVPLD